MSWLVATPSVVFMVTATVRLYERMTNNAEARSLLLKWGERFQLSDDALNDLKIYVMGNVYGYVRYSSLDVLRAEKWRCQKKKSPTRLPPDDDCLKQHIMRANFLAYIRRHPQLRDHPSPVGYGGTFVSGRRASHLTSSSN